ncbi:hypothetical protein PVE_R2G0846 [Pseudomonas veronii 1YdBTEX2]|jgi:hypothetical protein|uniref:Uncharacterized protein n=1 Tax=Pseudomonas veronii 1YdBTEX2 TaxID=1295141 RepID=A0A1D3K9D4_PSEVE|nr:hypothetical protein PVE_R2G0846 [Pseudomonas veronii 1YdBTEX2]
MLLISLLEASRMMRSGAKVKICLYPKLDAS